MALPTHVECIDDDHSSELTKGQVYEVISETSVSSSGSYSLKGVTCGWMKSRFKDVSSNYGQAVAASSIPTHVECVDASSSYGELVIGQIYEVIGENPRNSSQWLLKMIGGMSHNVWDKSRFKAVVSPSMSVPYQARCIKPCAGLIKDHIYTVTEEYNNINIAMVRIAEIAEQPGERFYADRFERIGTPADIAISKPKAPIHDSDPVEDRMWQLMRPQLLPDECPCGTKKSVCIYHKDA